MKSLTAFNLSGGMIALVLVLSRTVPAWAQSGYQVEEPEPAWSQLALHDPKLGDVVASFEEHGAAFLLVVSDCGDCNRAKVAAFAAADFPEGISRVVVVENVPTREEISKKFGRFPGIRYQPLGEDLKAELNVSFTPRAYLLDAKKTVRYVQPPSLSYGQAFAAMRRLINAGS